VINQAGYRRGKGKEEEWLFHPGVWRSEVTSSLNSTTVAKVLREHGMLHKVKDGFQQVVKVEGRSQRFYVVTAKILDGGDDG